MIFRELTKNRILKILDNSPLGMFAFDVSFPTESNPNKKTFEIFFIGDNKYYLKLREDFDNMSFETHLSLACSPGKYLNDEDSKELTSFENIFEEVEIWVDRVFEELKNKSPLLKSAFNEINRLEEEFGKKINEKLDLNDKSYFTQEEIIDIKSKLDELYTNFEKLKESNELKDSELKLIKAELNKLKVNIDVLPKNTWLKNSGKKIIHLIGQYVNPETFKNLSNKAIKGLLGEI